MASKSNRIAKARDAFLVLAALDVLFALAIRRATGLTEHEAFALGLVLLDPLLIVTTLLVPEAPSRRHPRRLFLALAVPFCAAVAVYLW